jgi:hypothetical protein
MPRQLLLCIALGAVFVSSFVAPASQAVTNVQTNAAAIRVLKAELATLSQDITALGNRIRPQIEAIERYIGYQASYQPNTSPYVTPVYLSGTASVAYCALNNQLFDGSSCYRGGWLTDAYFQFQGGCPSGFQLANQAAMSGAGSFWGFGFGSNKAYSFCIK